MAKSPKKGRDSRARADRRHVKRERFVIPYGVLLVSSSVDRTFDATVLDADEEDISLAYSANAILSEETDTDILYQCALSASMHHSNEHVFDIEALYVFSAKFDPEKSPAPDGTINTYLNTSVWLKFRDLFANASSQAGVNMPMLPLSVEFSFKALSDVEG